MKKKKILDLPIYEYTGVIHIHTKYSFDSRGELKDIIYYAKINNIDYIALTDHLSLDIKQDVARINCTDPYVLVGYEMNDERRNNHYLVFNTNKVLSKKLSASEYVKIVAKDNGIGFIAHPIEKRRSKKFRKFEWDAWDATKFDGMEIWNYLSEWTEHLTYPFVIFQRSIFPNLSVYKPYKETVKKWDEFNKNGMRKAAIGSIDAHSKKISLGLFSFDLLSYKKLFKTIRTNIWLREPISPKKYKEQLLQALKKGRSIIVNYNKGNPEMFYFCITTQNHSNFALPGEEIKLSKKKLFLFVYTPFDCRIKVIKNGNVIQSKYSNKINIVINKKGFYRVEIYKGLRAWIFSNPIYVV